MVSLTSPYTGPFNIPVLFNKEYYQISRKNPSTGYICSLVQVPGGPGTLPAGTKIIYYPSFLAYLANTFTFPVGGPLNNYQLIVSDASVYSVGQTVETGSAFQPPGMGFLITSIDLVANTLTVNVVGPYSYITGSTSITFPTGQPIITAGVSNPTSVVGVFAASVDLSSTTTVPLVQPYSGQANLLVTVNGTLYRITHLANATHPTVIYLLNLSDVAVGTYASGLQIYSIPELPAGRMGTYGMGCNCICLTDGLSYVIGDVVGGGSGTPANNYRDAVLKITQNTFLAGGGNFRLPGTGDIITAMAFPPIMDTSLGQGPLQVGTGFSFFTNVVPGTNPSTWESLTFTIQTEALAGTGPLGQNSTILVNSDVFFRSTVGIGSLVQARRDFSSVSISLGSSYGWGNTPISNEMQRILNKDNQTLLSFSSATNFDNRFFCTCAPNVSAQGVFHVGLVGLNFDLISSLQAKLPPACGRRVDGHQHAATGVWPGERFNPSVLVLVQH